jgi:hypothetical protein
MTEISSVRRKTKVDGGCDVGGGGGGVAWLQRELDSERNASISVFDLSDRVSSPFSLLFPPLLSFISYVPLILPESQ